MVTRPPIEQPEDKATRLIVLTQGQVALVDTEDYEWLSKHLWHAWWSEDGDCFYAVRSTRTDGKRGTVLMHREVMGAIPLLEKVDHVYGATLDNRKSQLRVATTQQNAFNQKRTKANTSGYKGVSFDKRTGRWMACITHNHKTFFLGRFDTPEEAHQAYLTKATELFGEFARAA